ncbi:MAG: UDP-N-acetylmuramoyl-L-alanine--D-glutamate ligase [Lachnospira sp.]|nr:UDP-N-acetylmuramoyl-L-alanine--D-glutamate ligase [Lachnospira sp.]
MNLMNKKVLVVGTGISGMGAVKLLNQVGADVVLYDGNDKLTVEEVEAKLAGEKAEIIIGELQDGVLTGIDLVVISPGVPIDSPLVLRFKAAGIQVWGEIELAYNYDKGSVLAITGTNGKTTTTALVGQIVGAWAEKTLVVGNIGNSYTKEVLNSTEESYTVAEISSFQLETVYEFRPKVSAILNITPDHLNRHHTMECYAQTKELISAKQTKAEICVLNYDDEMLRAFGGECSASVVWFSRKIKPEVGAYLDGDMIKYTDGVSDVDVINVHDMNLIGAHNYENVCAAVAITKAAGVPLDIITEQIRIFKAVEHRIEYVATKNGVMYYNDSKGTNPEAAVKAIEAMSRPTILIGGGYDKGSEFDLYVKAFGDKVKLLILIGQTKDKIAQTARENGFDNIIFADSMEEVVKICFENAVSGDAVLLSPACASWGMFDNYEQRGNMFKDYVNAL